jgi:hypothetical protein
MKYQPPLWATLRPTGPDGGAGYTVVLGLDPRITANSGVRGDPRIKSGEDVVERIVRQSPGPLVWV